ncbi:MAG: GTP 3',8-cyclase MoaA [Candidatus Sigynarchaeum springense]
MNLRDDYNRPVNYLRLSINRDCNYNCIYCDKEGNVTPVDGHMLSAAEIASIVQAFNEIGDIKKVKITGGEPLVHPDVIGVVKAISSIPTINEISMTTNGFYLARLAIALKAAGLNRVNISLCSLRDSTYKMITRVDGLSNVLEGIDAAITAGLVPVKINYVIMKGINDGELDAMLDFCGNKGLRLQIIELHEIPDTNPEKRAFYEKHHLDVESTLKRISKPVDHVEFRNLQHRKLVFFTNGASIEVIKPSAEFCAHCTKIRVTAEGKIKPCLMKAGTSFDLITKIREKRPGSEVRALVLKAIQARAPYMIGEGTGCH